MVLSGVLCAGCLVLQVQFAGSQREFSAVHQAAQEWVLKVNTVVGNAPRGHCGGQAAAQGIVASVAAHATAPALVAQRHFIAEAGGVQGTVVLATDIGAGKLVALHHAWLPLQHKAALGLTRGFIALVVRKQHTLRLRFGLGNDQQLHAQGLLARAQKRLVTAPRDELHQGQASLQFSLLKGLALLVSELRFHGLEHSAAVEVSGCLVQREGLQFGLQHLHVQHAVHHLLRIDHENGGGQSRKRAVGC